MKKGKIFIFTGNGHGKSPAAIGRAVQAACRGENVVILQFLKGKGLEESEYVRRLEPEIRLFRFEKAQEDFTKLSGEEKQEAVMRIRNGMNFARKIMATDECDMLILDEVLGLIDNGIITEEELKNLIAGKPEDMTLILTGITLHRDICVQADEVSEIKTVHFAD